MLINESKMEERVPRGWDGKVEGRNGVWVRMEGKGPEGESETT